MSEFGTPTPPEQTGYYLLNTDGGMLTNGQAAQGAAPGEASIAVVLKNHKDVLVEEFSGPIGPATIGVAEYRALIKGLELSLDRGITYIRVYVDSEFVVEQMNAVPDALASNYYSTARVRKDDLKLLHAEARQLANRFKNIRISWVPRERNQRADALATAALSSPSSP
jgi:ribonuclease HI